MSLKTGDRREAQERGAVLASLKMRITAMLNERIKASDATLTEGELQAIAKTAYGELLGRTCDDQRRFPHQAEHHSMANRAYADFYQRQAENGGQVPLLDGEEVALRFRGWPQDRIDRFRRSSTWPSMATSLSRRASSITTFEKLVSNPATLAVTSSAGRCIPPIVTRASRPSERCRRRWQAWAVPRRGRLPRRPRSSQPTSRQTPRRLHRRQRIRLHFRLRAAGDKRPDAR